jgi:hypothetical protein
MPIVTVRLLSASTVDKAAGPHEVESVRALVGVEGSRTTLDLEVPILSEAQSEDIRWYLEDYAELDAFNTERARHASTVLTASGKDLAWSIGHWSWMHPSELQEPLIVRVLETQTDALPHIFWELLEHLDLWRPSQRPQSVVVFRTAATSNPLNSAALTQSTQAHSERKFRILIVTARSNSRADIDPRLVSRLIVDVTEKYGNPANVQIVRPGTFEAFHTHLWTYPPGYFDIVHFDMHGVTDDSTNAVYLNFVKSEVAIHHQTGQRSIYLSSDLRSAFEVGQTLKERGVQQVVLNACRSAYGSRVETNMAKQMLEAGLSSVLAMSFTISDQSVQIFTAALYQSLIQHRLPLHAAACATRSAMARNSIRNTRFGTQVKVEDSIVLSLYTCSSIQFSVPAAFKVPDLNDMDMRKSLDWSRSLTSFPYGREFDMMTLETALLLGNKPVLVSGIAGIGKTTMLSNLRHWLSKTGLVKAAVHVHLPKAVLDIDALYRSIRQQIVDLGPQTDEQYLLSHLTLHRYLIILDSLDAADLTGKYAVFFKFLKSLRKTKSFVVLSSRRQEKWLASVSIPQTLTGLRILPSLQVIRKAANLEQEGSMNVTFSKEEDFHYLEHIIEIAGGNPVALQLMVASGLCRPKNPKDYYFDLLLGAPLAFTGLKDKDPERFRCFQQCDDIVTTMSFPTSSKDMKDPLAFALFQQVLPIKDLTVYVILRNVGASRSLGLKPQEQAQNALSSLRCLAFGASPGSNDERTVSEAEATLRSIAESADSGTRRPNIDWFEALISIEQFDLPKVPIFTNLMEGFCERYIDGLRQSNFLTEDTIREQPSGSRGQIQDFERQSLMVHPILPLIIRSQPSYHLIALIRTWSAPGFVRYFCYRSKDWPWSKIYYSREWAVPREELSREFTNFTTAILLGLDLKDLSQVELLCVARLALVLQRGALKRKARLRIVAIVWERTLSRVQREIRRLQAELWVQKSSARLGSFIRSWTSTTSPGQEQPENPVEIGAMPDDFVGLMKLGVEFSLAANLALYHIRQHSQQARSFTTAAARIIDDIERNLKRRNFSQKFCDKAQIPIEFAKLNLDLLLDPTNTEHQSRFKQMREIVHRPIIDNEDGGDYSDEIPLDLVGSSAHFSHMTSIYINVRKAIDAENWSKAERMVDDAFVAEINEASNDAIVKAGLLRFRSEIAEGRGQWNNALEQLQEAWRLRDEVNRGYVDPSDRKSRARDVARLKAKMRS